MNTQIGQWGHSLAVRIPKAMADKAQLSAGDNVELSLAEDGAIIVRRGRRRFTIDELVDGITQENMHPETEWGPAVGNEAW